MDFLTCIVIVTLVNVAFVIWWKFKESRQNRNNQTDYFELSGVPRPKPLPDFDVRTSLPRPYRPFRWPYHQTMALMPLEPDWWLELESTYEKRIAQRRATYESVGTAVLDALPGSEAACTELMEMVIQFLCTRYPNQFIYDPETGVFWNKIRDKKSPTRFAGNSDSASSANEKEKAPKAIHALRFLLDHVPEDFTVMIKDEVTGFYHLRAAVALSALGWNLHDKLGKPLNELHEPVPDYQEKLRHSVDRYFTKLTPEKPIQRGSWGLEIGEPLYLQSTDPEWKLRESQDPALDLSSIHLRVDWQTLRRLPRSGAIVFNYKALFTPFKEFRNEPYIPRLLATVLRRAPAGIKEYKGTYHTEHKVIPALDEWAREQEEKGWVSKEWEPRTLDEHPFFPGWSERLADKT